MPRTGENWVPLDTEASSCGIGHKRLSVVERESNASGQSQNGFVSTHLSYALSHQSSGDRSKNVERGTIKPISEEKVGDYSLVRQARIAARPIS